MKALLAASLLLAGSIPAHASTVDVGTVADLTKAYPPGTILRLRRGASFQCPCTFRSSGTADGHIKIVASDGSGPPARLKGTAKLYDDILTLAGSYVDVRGLTFSDTNRNGVRSTGHDNTVSNSEFTRVGQAIAILGDDFKGFGNSFHDLTMVKNTPTDTTSPATTARTNNDDYGAEAYMVDASHVELGLDRIARASAMSFDYGNDGGGYDIFATRPIEDIDIHDTTVTDSAGVIEAGGSAGGSVTDLHMHGMVAVNDGQFTCWHNRGGAFSTGFAAVHVDHNTVVQDVASPGLVMNRFDGPVDARVFGIDHNIFWMVGGDSIFKMHASDYHRDNSIYLGTPATRANPKLTHVFNDYGMDLSPGEVMLTGSPFVDLPGRNLALVPGSPAAGMGAQ